MSSPFHATVRRTRHAVAIAASVAAAAILAGTVVAGHLASDVKSYTGCLTTQGGTLAFIREGESPARPCPSGSVEAHFSGGDITGVTAGAGLIGGGTNGSVTLSLDPKYALRQDCADGQVLKWDAGTTSWTCANDRDTTYTAGAGLELDGTEFSLDSDYALPQDCDPGEAATWIVPPTSAFGEWGCRAFADAAQDCSSGKFANGIGADGDLKCATPSGGASSPSVWESFDTGNAPEGFRNEIVGLDLPTGNYLITAIGYASDDGGGDGDVDVACAVNEVGATVFAHSSDGAVPDAAIVIQGTATLAAPTHVSVDCESNTGSDHATITLTALSVGTINP